MPGVPPQPIWAPPLKQDRPDNVDNPGDVYFEEGGGSYNIYSLTYATTFTLLPGTFTIPSTDPTVGYRDTDVSSVILNQRKTLIGVIPLVNITSNNNYPSTPITFSFPSNNYAISVVRLEKDYYVIPQQTDDPANTNISTGLYKRTGDPSIIRLAYRNMLLINGIYDTSGSFTYGRNSMMFRMEIKQAATTPGSVEIPFSEKKIIVPLTILKTSTDISLNFPFTGIGHTKSNSIPDTSGNIVREWVDGYIDLSFSQFARTTRRNIYTGEFDNSDIVYYLSVELPRTFTKKNDFIEIVGNRILFKRNTTSLSNGISIKFLQEETPMYQRSSQLIGESPNIITINLIINKSTPEFANQIPEKNTNDPATVYRLPDLNKMTSEGAFILVPPVSTNTDTDASFSFTFSSSNENILKIRVSGTGRNTVYNAFLYGSGTSIVTVTQLSTTNFNQKVATFNVNVFEITPAVINCNTNLFYSNPYNRQFWTRFKPECRSSDFTDSSTGLKLTPSQVDEIYDMRRKVEILKYNKNVGGLTKNQNFAKASRGELMRKIGNSDKYITDTNNQFSLICPSTTANNRTLCGLTSACGVPGRERLLCYDPSINLYNYKRTYQYEAGLQLTSNIPTTILTEPTNLRVSEYDNVNKLVTITWDAPNSNGGFPITGYVITYSVDNKKWVPYESVFPYQPPAGTIPSYNPISGEINGNSVVFKKKTNFVQDILDNTIYYISVFSGNVRGLSSIPATITVKTSSVPSIINDFGFTNTPDERQHLMVDLKWSEPINTGGISGGGASSSSASASTQLSSSTSSYNGPPISMYNLYYRIIPTTTWIKETLSTTSIITSSDGGRTRRYVLRNLMNENKYQIKIEPINSVGVGPESAIITARTLMKPGVPKNVIMTSKYGLNPPSWSDVSRNYINITWNKPDTGGSNIKYYNITITPPLTIQLGASFTTTYDLSANDTRTVYSTFYSTINNIGIVDGSYSVVIEANNGYLLSAESSRSFVNVNTISAKALIVNIESYYSQSGLSYAELTFSINTQWQRENTITYVRVNGLNSEYRAYFDKDNQPISGAGEHTIRIPGFSSGIENIIPGTQYIVTVTLVYSNGDLPTSEPYTYVPEIKYLTL